MGKPSRPSRLLTLGVVCSEHNNNLRQQLRSVYKWPERTLLVRYVLDSRYVSELRLRGKLFGDEVGSIPWRAHVHTCASGGAILSLAARRAGSFAAQQGTLRGQGIWLVASGPPLARRPAPLSASPALLRTTSPLRIPPKPTSPHPVSHGEACTASARTVFFRSYPSD